MRSKRQKVVRWVAGVLAAVLLLLLAMPLWFPWLVAPGAKKAGLYYGEYARAGYSRFVLRSVAYTNRGVRFSANRVEAAIPTVWAMTLLRSGSVSYMQASDWTLVVTPSTNRPGQSTTSVYTHAQRVGAVVAKVEQWLPKATLTNGLVRFQGQTFKIQSFAWDRGKWNAIIQPKAALAPLSAEGSVSRNQPWRLTAEYAPLNLQGDFQIASSRSNLVLTGAVLFKTNDLVLKANFGRGSLLPDRASVQCDSFILPGRMIKLDSYGAVTGRVSFVWNDGRFVSELAARAEPPSRSQLPSLDVAIKADGTRQRAELQQLKITVPGFQAELSTNVVIPPAQDAPRAVLSIKGNLQQQPWVPLKGLIEGKVLLSGGTNIVPRAEFNLFATNTTASTITARAVVLNGNLQWPVLAIDEARADLDQNAVLNVTGTIDLTHKEITGGRLNFAGPPPPHLLPAKCSVDRVLCSANFDGPLDDLRHTEKIEVRGFKVPALKTLDGELTTVGRGQSVEGSALLRVGNSLLRLAASGNLAARTNGFLIKKLSLASAAEELLRLQEPLAIGFAVASNKWRLDLPQTTLIGPGREITLEGAIHWPGQAKCAGQIHGIALRDFQDLLTPQWNPVEVRDVAFNAEWQNGPATVMVSATAAYTEGPGFVAQGQLFAGPEGILISNLTATSQSAPVITARGFVPLTLNPASRTNIVDWRPAEHLELKAKMEPDPEFWRRIFDLTGLEVVRPDFSVDVSGSWNSPTGWLHASALKARLTKTTRPVPPIEEFRLDAQFDAQKLRLDQFRFLVEKQPVLLTGELPLDASFYDSLARRRMPDWERGRARIQIARAPIAAFMRYMPRVLTPLGVLDVDVTAQGTSNVQGQILIEGATSYPLGEFGAVRDITNRVVFRGQTAVLNSMATVGGEPVHTTGTIDLNKMRWFKGEIPPFQIKLTGKKIPLARQAQVIIRSDFDLRIVHTKTNQPVISGTVGLRDSFYTSDLESLIPTRLAKASHRPPYFSVEVEPISAWRLDCSVTGNEFLKLRTPFFQASVSSSFKLEGTLKEPLASGQATVPNGRVEFPFGTLDVKQGIVSVTAANPFQPEIYLTARARRFGYDITLQVTGTADKPIIQFSSVPSLSSEQILLLLTAGEVPKDEISLTPQQKAQRFAVFLAQRFLVKLGFAGSSERLSIRSGEEVSYTGHQTYDVEYKLDKNWSIVGQYDRFNAFNLSLKRRIYSR